MFNSLAGLTVLCHTLDLLAVSRPPKIASGHSLHLRDSRMIEMSNFGLGFSGTTALIPHSKHLVTIDIIQTSRLVGGLRL